MCYECRKRRCQGVEVLLFIFSYRCLSSADFTKGPRVQLYQKRRVLLKQRRFGATVKERDFPRREVFIGSSLYHYGTVNLSQLGTNYSSGAEREYVQYV